MTFFQKIGYYLLRGVCLCFGALPFVVLYYPMSWLVYVIVYKLCKYRVNIVRANLERAFPEYTNEKRSEIEKKFYKNLAETFIDTLDISGLTSRQVARRISIEDLDEHKKRVEGKDWISAMAHYGSWEYTSTYCFFDDTHNLAAIYRPLHSKVFDRFFKTFRTQYGANVVPMAEIIRFVISNKRDPKSSNVVLAMIADQVPMRKSHPVQIQFLGQDTLFFSGVEKMALKFNMPVYFLHIEKPGRAKYIYRFDMIYDGEEQVQEHEITRRYAQKLEEMVRQRPELWLWSHRRWKRTKASV
ncbi:MAG: lysophospholipid acyltransferase family protein [Rikenellaceae bacterium]